MPIEWAIILVVAVSDVILLAETSFRLDASSQLTTLAGLIVLAVVFVYCRWRRIRRLAHLARTGLALALFTNVASILSYILTGTLPLPRWDGALATADHALGLNWLDMYQWLIRHHRRSQCAHTIHEPWPGDVDPALRPGTARPPQPGKGIFALVHGFRDCHHSHRDTHPCRGRFCLLPPPRGPDTGYVFQWADLRNGTLRTINALSNQGLVVFPSFHATLGVLCIFAARPLRILKNPLLALNLLIILSSPAEGGHYFIDVIAGGRFNHKPAWAHLKWDTATLEEQYSTRGRARPRFEMMGGGAIRNGWTGNRDPARRGR